MLTRKFTPKAVPNLELINPTGNTLTILDISVIEPRIKEYLNQVKILIDDYNVIVRLIIEALILYYVWNTDFIDHGLKDLPKEEDMCTSEHKLAREALLECIIKAMTDIDKFNDELRILCYNSQSVSVINVKRHSVLLSLSIFTGPKH